MFKQIQTIAGHMSHRFSGNDRIETAADQCLSCNQNKCITKIFSQPKVKRHGRGISYKFKTAS
jgi:hypothetical protein